MTKALTVRLPDSVHADLSFVATVDDMTMTDVIRIAVERFVDARRMSPDFRVAAHDHLRCLEELLGQDSTP
jgi:predicted transcriptional regulator